LGLGVQGLVALRPVVAIGGVEDVPGTRLADAVDDFENGGIRLPDRLLQEWRQVALKPRAVQVVMRLVRERVRDRDRPVPHLDPRHGGLLEGDD
jgi:hypothetical protein